MFSPDAHIPSHEAAQRTAHTESFETAATQHNMRQVPEPLPPIAPHGERKNAARPEDIGHLDTVAFPKFPVREPLRAVSEEDLNKIVAASGEKENAIRARRDVEAYWRAQDLFWEEGAEQIAKRAATLDSTVTSLIASNVSLEKAKLWKKYLAEASEESADRVCSRRESMVYGSDGTPFRIDRETNELHPSKDDPKPAIQWFVSPETQNEVRKTAGERYTEKEVYTFFLEKLRREHLMNGGALSSIEEQTLTHEARELATDFRTRGFATRLENGGYLGKPVMGEKIGTLPFEGPTRAFAAHRLLLTFRMLGAFQNVSMGFSALTKRKDGETVLSVRPPHESWKPVTDELIVNLGMNPPSEWGALFLEAGLVTCKAGEEKTVETREKIAACVTTFQKGLAEAATFSALVGTMSKGSFRVQQDTGKVFLDHSPDVLSLATDLPCLQKRSGSQTALYINELDTVGRTGSVAFELADQANLQLDSAAASHLKQACEKMRQPGSPHGALVQEIFSLVHGDETIATLEAQRLLRLATFGADMSGALRLGETHKSFVDHQPNTPILLQLLKQQGYKKEGSKEAAT